MSSRKASAVMSKEEEYKRLNAELEAKTANLLNEAEKVLRNDNFDITDSSSLLENVNQHELLDEDDLLQLSRAAPVFVTETDASHQPVSARATSSRINKARAKTHSGKTTKSIGKMNDDAVVEAIFGQVIDRIESGQSVDASQQHRLPILPAEAEEMPAEAQIRFLKAKLRVLEEEMSKSVDENKRLSEDAQSQKHRVKELDEEKTRLSKSNTTLQQQLDKVKKSADENRSRAENLESQLSVLKKESEIGKKEQKKVLSDQSSTEVRLNRALEEVDKLKQQLSKTQSSAKETFDSDKKRLDQLLHDVKRLEKQKSELLNGFKKQMKLIDVLKKQKLHLEAARVLQFTEEEFIKTLDWSSNQA